MLCLYIRGLSVAGARPTTAGTSCSTNSASARVNPQIAWMGGQPSSDCSSSLGPGGQSPEVYAPGLAIVQVDGMADKGTRDPTVTSLITLSASWTLEIMYVNSR